MDTLTTTKPLATYVVRHADDNLVLGQRLSEYISWAPELEEDLAIANLALDHIGVAHHLYDYAAEVEDDGRDADAFAFLRDERQFTNVQLVERPNTDFAHIMARQFFVDAYQVPLWDALARSADERIAGIAAKAAKEARYHLRHSRMWVLRLGDGTEESHRRMQAAIDELWRFTGELFETDELTDELVAAGIAVDPATLEAPWRRTVLATLAEATLDEPHETVMRTGGRRGLHTEALGHLLAEMQFLQRAYPGLEW